MTFSDADRERVIELLREQAGEGRLDMDEYGQRLDEAYQATTIEELQHALRELPVPAILQPRPTAGGAATGPMGAQGAQPPRPYQRPRLPRPVDYDKLDAIARAAWKGHLHTYLWVNLMLVAIWVMTGADYHFWPMWSIVPWGIGVAAHGSAHRAGVKARQARRRRELPS